MRMLDRRKLAAVTALAAIVVALGFVVVRVARAGEGPSKNSLPALAYRDSLGSHVIRADSGTPTIIVLFDSRCGHCAYQLTDFDRRLADLAHARIYLLTTEQKLPLAELARRWPVLAKAQSVTWGMVSASEFRAQLNTLVTPALFVYDARGAFVTKYVGEVKVDALLPALAQRRAG
jgi:protein-disulfide isomerase